MQTWKRNNEKNEMMWIRCRQRREANKEVMMQKEAKRMIEY